MSLEHLTVGAVVHSQLKMIMEDPKSSPSLRYKAIKLLLDSVEKSEKKRDHIRKLRNARKKRLKGTMSKPYYPAIAPGHATELLSKLEQ